MELAEFLMKMLQIGAMSIALISLIVNSMSFEGNIELYKEQKLAIDFAQSILSDPCLVYEIDGDVKKGMFSYSKLKNVKTCVEIPGNYYVEISAYNDKWKFGKGVVNGESVEYPALVRYSEYKVVPARLKVKVSMFGDQNE